MNQETKEEFNTKLHILIDKLISLLTGILPLQNQATRDAIVIGLSSSDTIPRAQDVVTDWTNIVHFTMAHSKLAWARLKGGVLRYVKKEHQAFNNINECFDEIAALLQSNVAAIAEIDGKRLNGDIPFTNRERELKFILTDRSPAHHIIDGPVGYGKTRMLEELEYRLAYSKEEKHLCGRVSVKENFTITSLVTALCKALNLDVNAVVGTDGNAEGISLRFGQEIVRSNFSPELDTYQYEGVVILLDDIGVQFQDVSNQILEIFIPTVGETLRHGNEEFFSEKTNSFRVILAGRYLAQFVHSRVPKLPWQLKTTVLTPFEYDVVSDTARKVLKKRKNVEQTAAHLLHISGGHPSCLAKILLFCLENPAEPETFLQFYANRLWSEITKSQVDAIRESITPPLLPICDRLSVFRVFNSEILRQLIEKKAFSYTKSVFSLKKELATTFLYDTTPPHHIGDSIVRRMLVLYLTSGQTASEFSGYCNQAFAICKTLLEKPEGIDNRDMWAIECLYQALQSNFNSISTSDERANLRETFIGVTVPDVVKAFIRLGSKRKRKFDAEDVADQLEGLIKEMNFDRNWDFRFVVNYFLRGEAYTEEPFASLIDTVRTWIDKEEQNV